MKNPPNKEESRFKNIKIIAIRDILTIISLIVIMIYTTFFYQNAFNYEMHIYSYYTLSMMISILVTVYISTSIITRKRKSDGTDFLLIPGLLFFLYSLNCGNEYAIVFGSCFLLFFIIKSASAHVLKYLIYIAFGIYILQCIFTIYSYLTDVHDISSIYINTGIFSIYCIVFIPLGYYIINELFTRNQANIVFVIYTLIIITIIITLKSRTAIITLFAVFVIPYIIRWVRDQKLWTRHIFLIAFLTIFSFGILYLFQLKQGSSFGRFLMIDVALSNINYDNIWKGVGLGNFNHLYPNWQSSYFKSSSNPKLGYFLNAGETYVIFNEFLQAFISIGIIPFVILSYFVIKYFFIKKEDPLWRMIKTSFLIILFCSLTYYTLHINIVLVVITFYSAVIYKLLYANKKVLSIPHYLLRAINIITLCLALYISYNVLEKNKAISSWKILKRSYNSTDNIEQKLIFIEKKLNSDGRFLADYGNYLYEYNSNLPKATYYIERSHNSFINLRSKETLAYLYLEQKDYDRAIEEFEWLVNYIPNKFSYRLELINLYASTDNYRKALQLANYTLNMPIKIHSQNVDIIKNQIKLIKDSLNIKVN